MSSYESNDSSSISSQKNTRSSIEVSESREESSTSDDSSSSDSPELISSSRGSNSFVTEETPISMDTETSGISDSQDSNQSLSSSASSFHKFSPSQPRRVIKRQNYHSRSRSTPLQMRQYPQMVSYPHGYAPVYAPGTTYIPSGSYHPQTLPPVVPQHLMMQQPMHQPMMMQQPMPMHMQQPMHQPMMQQPMMQQPMHQPMMQQRVPQSALTPQHTNIHVRRKSRTETRAPLVVKSPPPKKKTTHVRRKTTGSVRVRSRSRGSNTKHSASHSRRKSVVTHPVRERRNTMELEGVEENRKLSFKRILTMLSYQKRQWILFTENVYETVLPNQVIRCKPSRRNYFPSKTIDKLQSRGYSIRQIAYGAKKWIIVADLFANPQARFEQKCYFLKSFPQRKIEQAWQKSERVVYLNYCYRYWVLVTEKNEEIGTARQRLIVRFRLPKHDIAEIWNEELYFRSSCSYDVLCG
eukprot:TRINITY_DN1627_c0_g1_i2.p1 TRINITY_DN1627_c0_g1~~TRINITY_DN1627_c0_g1_i2.p1  ORF type:complete len:466 (-),score=41.82 TRINITY_DN1627_c0_g1_i2:190-1587(-)